MDISGWITPGAEQLAAKMMDQGWSAIRDAIARRIARGRAAEAAKAASSLDSIRDKALSADPRDRTEILLAYCAGYLDALAAVRPDLADLTQGLQPEGATTAPDSPTNLNTGRVGKLAQVGRDVTGGITQ